MVNFSVPCGNGNPEGWVQQQDNSEFCYLLYSDALMFFDDANDYCKTQVKFFWRAGKNKDKKSRDLHKKNLCIFKHDRQTDRRTR